MLPNPDLEVNNMDQSYAESYAVSAHALPKLCRHSQEHVQA